MTFIVWPQSKHTFPLLKVFGLKQPKMPIVQVLHILYDLLKQTDFGGIGSLSYNCAQPSFSSWILFGLCCFLVGIFTGFFLAVLCLSPLARNLIGAVIRTAFISLAQQRTETPDRQLERRRHRSNY